MWNGLVNPNPARNWDHLVSATPPKTEDRQVSSPRVHCVFPRQNFGKKAFRAYGSVSIEERYESYGVETMGKTTVALVLLSISVLFAFCASPSAVNVYVDKKGYCRVNGKLVKERSVPAALAKSGVSSSTPINIRGVASRRRRR